MYKKEFEKRKIENRNNFRPQNQNFLFVTIFLCFFKGNFSIVFYNFFLFSLTKLHSPVQYLPSPDTTNPGGH